MKNKMKYTKKTLKEMWAEWKYKFGIEPYSYKHEVECNIVEAALEAEINR